MFCKHFSYLLHVFVGIKDLFATIRYMWNEFISCNRLLEFHEVFTPFATLSPV
ncbi:hypothetical protein HMPREF0742_01455 [Rothia aeria F0184]|uniref:Uncharacterized protein n=1 Tax=Rothia aeria F0184 TaxID=888019 RepID=U7V3E8_9MICC|nr:hypothetical protein HMPREF0742_01455 [Rothia aeria F0184]